MDKFNRHWPTSFSDCQNRASSSEERMVFEMEDPIDDDLSINYPTGHYCSPPDDCPLASISEDISQKVGIPIAVQKVNQSLNRTVDTPQCSYREIEVIQGDAPANADELELTLGNLKLTSKVNQPEEYEELDEYQQRAITHYPCELQHPSAPQNIRQQKKQELITKKRICVADFQLLAVLGRGSYGKVFQVKKKENGKIYAMKVLRKSEIVKRKIVKHTNSERTVLAAVQHPFIVDLRFAFQTDSKLYLILDYIPGGELFKRLDEVEEFSESEARFYGAEVVLALGYLHSLDIIYRDLKPENIMLGRDGHIVLTDFGFAKADVETDTDSKTFCGTVDYMSPEIISKTGHGKAADWWGLGILLYEMITGKTPFSGRNRKQILQNILIGRIKLYSWMSEESKTIIQGLLHRSVAKRLGSGPHGTEEIKKHPFFGKHIDWVALINKVVNPPWMPVIKGQTDISNFDETFTKEAPVDSPLLAGMPVPSPSLFQGFTYTAESPSFGSITHPNHDRGMGLSSPIDLGTSKEFSQCNKHNMTAAPVFRLERT